MNDGWEVDYVRRVLRETDLTPTALARRAGFAATTITRALHDPKALAIYALIGAGAATIILS